LSLDGITSSFTAYETI